MFETFSYLPPLTDAEISRQVDYIVNNGWSELNRRQRRPASLRCFTSSTPFEGSSSGITPACCCSTLLHNADSLCCSSMQQAYRAHQPRPSFLQPAAPLTPVPPAPSPPPLQPPAWSSLSRPAPTPATRTASA